MPTSEVKIGIVGLTHPHAVPGHEPVSWLDTLNHSPEMAVTAVTEQTPHGKELARRFLPETPLYSDIATMLESHPDIEAALVLLPNRESAGALSTLVQRGVHFAFDKPGARNASELSPLVPQVESKRLITAVAYLRRHHPMLQEVRRVIDQEILGRLWMIELRLFTTQVRVRGPQNPLFSKEASGGGILHWMGCHMIDLLFYLTRSHPERVRATTANLSNEPIDVEDTALLSLQLQSGVLANVATGYLRPAGNDLSLTMHCQHGTLHADMLNNRLDISDWSKGQQTATTTSFLGSSEIPCYGSVNGIRFLQAFAHEIQRRRQHPHQPVDDHELPFATIHDAAAVLEAIEAAYAED